MSDNTQNTKFVLVTTGYRGVFAGYLEKLDDRTITLTRARCAIHWNTNGGFLELAAIGPNSGSKIGTEAERIVLFGVTSIIDCSDAAVEKWLSLP